MVKIRLILDFRFRNQANLGLLELKLLSPRKIFSELNKKICEAANCDAKATAQILLRAGQKRTISLELCERCKEKFQDD